ncbi:MAG: glycosyltransferase domain containing protein [uncultured Corynebacteriales bacterium]|uniref:Glycosyltransferase domain containing protein n=1 Tax=uncultured Mycobacteriales bacterium TaxID=581187 RepID=A0A6J4J6L2_9ACTN|nr:MAG: glycosyltransferase domain containing protein [uncultured Corynebacteriales bacterium]
MSRVVVATGDVLGERIAGPAIRAWQIAEVLAAAGHEVQLVTILECAAASDRFTVRHVGDAQLRELEAWCDTLVFQGSLMHEHQWLRDSVKPLVVDVYDPFHLELLEQARDEGEARRRDIVHNAVVVLNDQLRRGDFFLCASEKQRDLWIGSLAALGRVNTGTYDGDETLRGLIAVAPFGLDAAPPVRTGPGVKGVVEGIGPDDKLLLWGGGIYNWFDPLTLIRAVELLGRERDDVRLFFMGLAHPNPRVPKMRMAVAAEKLAADLGLLDRSVFFNQGWVPYAERANVLLDADLGVSTHLDHVETAYSFRTRLLDCLWAGMPQVATRGDSLAELIDAEGLGLTVPPGDAPALAAAIGRLLDEPELAAGARAAAARVAAGFTWPTVLAPLVDFCAAPHRAPDLLDEDLVGRMAPALGIVSHRPVGLRANAALARDYLKAGGPTLVATKVASRLRNLAAGR